MKKHALVVTMASSAVLLAGCANPDGSPNNTGSGALIGGTFGLVAGSALAGCNNSGEGALIGAAAGAITGALIGHSMDQAQNARLRAQAPTTYVKVTQNQPLEVADVKALAAAKVSDDAIIAQIQNSHTVYHLAAADIIDLRNSGVSDRVVNYMINTPNTIGNIAAAAPPSPGDPPPVIQQSPPPAPTDEVQAATPGPSYVWVSGEWVWNGSAWYWVGGHWANPPYSHAVWVAGYRWHDGYGWHYRAGYWQ